MLSAEVMARATGLCLTAIFYEVFSVLELFLKKKRRKKVEQYKVTLNYDLNSQD